mmetsp:Transcript_48166/g.116901  ORF Transcript_48166/g.116901 Transcript_48166/m.116901 type:complete len:81 (-) Transcript_48166:60-302(-)
MFVDQGNSNECNQNQNHPLASLDRSNQNTIQDDAAAAAAARDALYGGGQTQFQKTKIITEYQVSINQPKQSDTINLQLIM